MGPVSKTFLNEKPALGLFSQASYLHEGDPYVKKSGLDSRYKGTQFKTNPPKKGKTNDVFLQKSFTPLYEGEKYVEPVTYDRQEAIKKKKKNLHGPFKPSGGTKKANGAGSYDGLMSKPPAHEPEFNVPRPGDGPVTKPSDGKRKIYTNPPKLGGTGTLDRFVGQAPPEYKTEPFEPDNDKARVARERAKAKMLGGPFKVVPSGRSDTYFDSGDVYRAPRKVPTSKKKKKGGNGGKKVIANQWRSSGRKSGQDGCFSPFPKYEPDPVGDRELKVKKMNQKNKPLYGAFRPASGAKSRPTKPSRPATAKW